MIRQKASLFLLVTLGLLALPFRSPAPLVYTPGEGWHYETPDSAGKWQKQRAKDQLDVAQAALDKKDYSLALKASRRTVKVWPLSDHAPQAQYILARCYEARGREEKAFNEYQKLLEKYPKISNYDEIIERQYLIATAYLGGKWFKLWGVVPFFPSMDKTATMYEKVIKNGPYSPIAPKAQMNIGSAREKQADYPLAVKAYERAADRYNDRSEVAAEALHKAGMAYYKQAKTAEYDQNSAAQAIATFTDFMTLYPDEPRIPEVQRLIAALRTEQARGSYKIAKFYEKKKRWDGALVYYNEVLLKDPNSTLAAESRSRIESLKSKANPPKN